MIIKKTTLLKCLYILFIINLLSEKIRSQEIPKEFIEYKLLAFSYDNGKKWESKTLLGPFRFQEIRRNNLFSGDSLNVSLRFGLSSIGKSIGLYGFSHFTFKKYLYGYLYPRIVNNPDVFPRYSGIKREISRGSFNSGETDLSGIGLHLDI